jgi:hypothetical protein
MQFLSFHKLHHTFDEIILVTPIFLLQSQCLAIDLTHNHKTYHQRYQIPSFLRYYYTIKEKMVN